MYRLPVYCMLFIRLVLGQNIYITSFLPLEGDHQLRSCPVPLKHLRMNGTTIYPRDRSNERVLSRWLNGVLRSLFRSVLMIGETMFPALQGILFLQIENCSCMNSINVNLYTALRLSQDRMQLVTMKLTPFCHRK